MAKSRWKPLGKLKALRHNAAQWVKRRRAPFRPAWAGWGEERVMRLPLDAYATADEVVIRAAVPGLDPEEVEVTLVGNTLTIEGQFVTRTQHVDYLFKELVTGPFRREVILNVPIRADEVQARFRQGILTVILPKDTAACSNVVAARAAGTKGAGS